MHWVWDGNAFRFVIQSEAKNLGYINVDVIEILPPFGRLNDITGFILFSDSSL